MSRLTPFEHLFASWGDAPFARIRDEGAAAGVDTSDRAQFASLPAVQEALTQLEVPDLIAAEPMAGPAYLHLFYATYRFWVAGQPLVSLDRAALETALSRDDPVTAPMLPHTACYLQLPLTHVWAPVDSEHPHEPLDGVFVARRADGGEYSVVAVLGLHPEREGFSQVALLAAPDDFPAARAAARTPPFTPVLEGGDRAGIRSVVSAAELLLLVALALGPAGL